MQTWETHFKGVLQVRETWPNETDLELCTDINQGLFTIEEVEKALKELKNWKACSPDQIYNEHLKDTTPTLKGVWTNLFNECLKREDSGRLAARHSESLYEGKGDVSDPNVYRGIALECTAFKLLSSILTKRLNMMTENTLPNVTNKCMFRTVDSGVCVVSITLSARNTVDPVDGRVACHQGKKVYYVLQWRGILLWLHNARLQLITTVP
jgi:hypothetical protein